MNFLSVTNVNIYGGPSQPYKEKRMTKRFEILYLIYHPSGKWWEIVCRGSQFGSNQLLSRSRAAKILNGIIARNKHAKPTYTSMGQSPCTTKIAYLMWMPISKPVGYDKATHDSQGTVSELRHSYKATISSNRFCNSSSAF